MTNQLEPDLNTTIASAVQARVEASVLAALSSDDTFGRLVTSAMMEPVDVKQGYRTVQVPYIHHVIDSALRKAVRNAVDKFIAEEQEMLEAAAATALRKDAKTIAGALVGSLANTATHAYGLTMDIDLKVARPASD